MEKEYRPYCPEAYHLPPGTVLQDRYRIGGALGESGFGITYIAWDMTSARQVAVKEYFPLPYVRRGDGGAVVIQREIDPLERGMNRACFEDGLRRFQETARILICLEGMREVIQGLEYLETNNTGYLVTELPDGTPLYQIVEKMGRIPAWKVMNILFPLFRALSILYERGLNHWDICPDNILWMPDGTLKLLAFDCAETRGLHHGFAPVEKYLDRNRWLGPRMDVYALSATIYYCLTGIVPPCSLDRLMEDNLIPPRELGVDLPEWQERAILRGMTVHPQQRIQTVRELFDALYVPDPPWIPND